MMNLEGQISIDDFLKENNNNEITKEQRLKAEEIKSKEKNCIFVLFNSGTLGVVIDRKSPTIVPQGDVSKAFTPKGTRKTFYIYKDGTMPSCAWVGDASLDENIKIIDI